MDARLSFPLWFGDAAYRKAFIVCCRATSSTLGSPQHRRVEEAARKVGIRVSLGVSERDGDDLFMGIGVINPNGETLVVRRKSKPSGREWDVFASGPGNDVTVAQTPAGNVGTLRSNENLRPLMRPELYQQDIQIQFSSWPHFGLFPGRRAVSYVLAAGASVAIERVATCVIIAATQIASQAYIDELRLPPGAVAAGSGASRIFEPVTAEVIGGLADPTFDGLIYADIGRGAV